MKASVHKREQEMLPGWMDTSIANGVDSLIDAHVPERKHGFHVREVTASPMKVTPELVGKFYRRTHQVNSQMFVELQRQAAFYNPQLEIILKKLWASVDRCVRDMTDALDANALHVKALQAKMNTLTDDYKHTLAVETKAKDRAQELLDRTTRELNECRGRLKVAERLERQHNREKDLLENMLTEYVYGADAKPGTANPDEDKPDYENEYVVLEDMEERLIELTDEMLWAKSIAGEMDQLVSRMGVANAAALEEAARIEEERIQKTMAHAEAQARAAALRAKKMGKKPDQFSQAKAFLMSTQQKTLGAMSRDAQVQAGMAVIRHVHMYGVHTSLISAREQPGTLVQPSSSMATPPVIAGTNSIVFPRTYGFFPHLALPSLCMPLNTHKETTRSPKSTKAGDSKKSPKGASRKATGNTLRVDEDYAIDPSLLSPTVLNFVDVKNLRSRTWYVFDCPTICHKIMCIYANYMVCGTKEATLLEQEQNTRMKNRRSSEATAPAPVFSIPQKHTSCLAEFVCKYFESQMNVKSLGDWHATQLILNVTRYHDETIHANADAELGWYDDRIVLFGRLVGALSGDRNVAGSSGENKEAAILFIKALNRICRMTPTINAKTLTNPEQNQNIMIDMDHIGIPLFQRLMSDTFSAELEEYKSYSEMLYHHANILAENRRAAAAAAAAGDTPQPKSKRQSMVQSPSRRNPTSSPESPGSSIRADKIYLDSWMHVLLRAFWDFRDVRCRALTQHFEIFRKEHAPTAKERVLANRKKYGKTSDTLVPNVRQQTDVVQQNTHTPTNIQPISSNETLEALQNEQEESVSAVDRTSNSSSASTLHFDKIFRMLQDDEDTVDAIELGLLPWRDVYPVTLEIVTLCEAGNVNDAKTASYSKDAESTAATKKEKILEKIMKDVNNLSRDPEYWNALVEKGVYVEAKARALERVIRNFDRKSPKSETKMRRRRNATPIYGETDEWKNYTEEDIEDMVKARATAPGIDGRTFAEVMLQNRVGWTPFQKVGGGQQ